MQAILIKISEDVQFGLKTNHEKTKKSLKYKLILKIISKNILIYHDKIPSI